MKTSNEYICEGIIMAAEVVSGIIGTSKQKNESAEKTLWRINLYIDKLLDSKREMPPA